MIVKEITHHLNMQKYTDEYIFYLDTDPACYPTKILWCIAHEELVKFDQHPDSFVKEATRIIVKHTGLHDAENVIAKDIWWYVKNGYVAEKESSVSPGTASPIESMAHELPGVHSKVKYPCGPGCTVGPGEDSLFNVIIHLNDKHRWSRDRIADWIDRLHDAGIINVEFTGEEPKQKYKYPKHNYYPKFDTKKYFHDDDYIKYNLSEYYGQMANKPNDFKII